MTTFESRSAETVTDRHIVHFSEVVGGGVWTVLLGLCSAVDSDTWTGEAFVLGRPGDVGAEVPDSVSEGFRIRRLRGGRSRLTGLGTLAVRAARVLRLGHVVHCHSTVAGVVVRSVAVITGRRAQVIYSPHGYAFLDPSRSWRFRWTVRALERLLSRGCAMTITVSASESSVAAELKAAGVRIIPNGVDLQALEPLDDQRVERRPMVVAAGRWALQKRPWIFADIATAVVNHYDADFIWLGADPDPDDPWLSRAPVRTVAWVPREKLLGHLAEAAMFVMPSGFEGMPMALIEAQALGVPAVVMDVPGCTDVVIDQVTGIVCRDPREMEAVVTRLLANPEELRTLAAGALRRRGRLDARETIRLYEESYEYLVNELAGRR